MENDNQIELKELLRHEVDSFCQRDATTPWKREIFEVLIRLKEAEWPAVFFGGTLRSLLVSRLNFNQLGRPRDIDIVVQGPSPAQLKEYFSDIFRKETRFGGLQLQNHGWQFDIWPLNRTWAFENASKSLLPEFKELPHTTFFNIEAIAVEVWPQPGCQREIFGGDDLFFKGIEGKTIEINNMENPFPELCVVRSLVFADDLQFTLGPNLLKYIVTFGKNIKAERLEEVQQSHYGKVRLPGSRLKEMIRSLSEHGQDYKKNSDIFGRREISLSIV